MRRYALLSALMLAGCMDSQPLYLVHRTGSAPAERQAAITNCQVAALQAVPRALATDVSGGYSNPGSIQCNTFGSMTTCNRIGAVNIPASSYTYDANRELRERVTDQCLNRAGYDVIVKPACMTEANRNAYLASRAAPAQPPADQIPCVIRS